MKILVTGITGTLGHAVTKRLIDKGYDVYGLSRDEQKQQHFKYKDDVKLILGDVRSKNWWPRLPGNIEYIFHFAALKCIDILEASYDEALLTNIEGTRNILNLQHRQSIPHVILASTDKACYPINIYGMTKAIAEKLIRGTCFDNMVCRYGNVMGSRGSVVPLFIDKINRNLSIPLTMGSMTRFWLTIDQAADFVIKCAFKRTRGTYIPSNLKSCSITALIDAFNRVMKKDFNIINIPIRAGEKLHECIQTQYEGEEITSDMASRQMKDLDLDNMLYYTLKEIEKG